MIYSTDKVMDASAPCCSQTWPMDDKTQVCCPHIGPLYKTEAGQDQCCEDEWRINNTTLYNSKTQVRMQLYVCIV